MVAESSSHQALVLEPCRVAQAHRLEHNQDALDKSKAFVKNKALVRNKALERSRAFCFLAIYK